jgi:REP element-mobilizing transposase RayT
MPIHCIWSTKYHQSLIKPAIEKELFSYMAAIYRENDSPALIINGTQDHVHILTLLSRKITVADLIEEVKKNSSKWIKSKGIGFENFYWQNGYAALGIGQSHVNVLMRYIRNQKEHHRKKTFKQEYISFLRKYSIDYDERYLWD